VTTTIAIAGKGGTGKTTVAAFLIELLADKGSVLAIDADPSSNLHMVLGLPLEETVGGVREEMLTAVSTGSFGVGLSKQDWFDLRINEALVESDRVDLLAMGRPEGPGCYCAANQMLRVIVDRLNKQYDYVVIDNEAGMEHLSRRTTRDVDVLLLVTDPTQRGIVTAQRMAEMVPGLEIGVGHTYLIVNRLRGEMPAPLAQTIEQTGLKLVGVAPEDPAMAEFEFTGRPLVELPAETAVYQAVQKIAESVMG